MKVTSRMGKFQLKKFSHKRKTCYSWIALQVLTRLKRKIQVRIIPFSVIEFNLFMLLHHRIVVGQIFPESIVHKLFIGGILNHLNQEYVSLIHNVFCFFSNRQTKNEGRTAHI